MKMETKEVAAAIIRRGDKIFATQRGYGEFKDWWEFPGGKMEPGETAEVALIREIKEELDADIYILKKLRTVEWDYPTFHLKMHCFTCSLIHDALHLNEHESARWLRIDELDSVQWLPADRILLPMIATELKEFDHIVNPPKFKIGDIIYWHCDADQMVHHAKVLMVNYALMGNHIEDVNYEVIDECDGSNAIRFIDEYDAFDHDLSL
jgi:8-oxo-dGTP diphosphatase